MNWTLTERERAQLRTCIDAALTRVSKVPTSLFYNPHWGFF